ncbi:MAG: hypothetical protein JSW71_01550 [Gemmatimonadota bacterium]|nr:MAG: hypothetical protein JSW71_01550 [Gemmatimonadota bacterium]
MIAIASLWPAILLSAAVVWIAAMVVWTVLPHHQSDYRGFPDEEAVRTALGRALAPGQYNIPHIPSREDANKPDVRQKFDEGPIGFMTVLPRGLPSTVKGLVLSFVFYLLIGCAVAYVCTRTIPPGADYLAVFRISGTVAWLAYGTAVVPDAIWFGRPWSAIGKQLLDALLLGGLTGGVFGWLWPS